MDVEAIAYELYGLPPDEFTAARNDKAKQARAAGDRDVASRVAALRKPTVAAWALNQLVREHNGEIEVLLDLGEELRAGMQGLSGEELRTLTRRRHQLVSALVGLAEKLAAAAGRNLGSEAAGGVRGTLDATLADAESAAQLSRGCLTEPLAPPGFGFGDLTPRAADPEPEPSLSEGATVADLDAHRKRKEKAVKAAETEVARAEAAFEKASSTADEAAERAADAEEDAAAASSEVTRLEKELDRARAELDRRNRKLEKRRARHADAEEEKDEADEALDDARAALERLR